MASGTTSGPVRPPGSYLERRLPSLAGRLGFAFAVLLTVLVAARVVDQLERQVTRQRLADRICEHSARDAAQAFLTSLGELARTFRTLGLRVVAGHLTPPQASALLEEIRLARSDLGSIQVFDPTRGLLAQASPREGSDLTRAPALPRLSAEEPFALSRLFQAGSPARERTRLSVLLLDESNGSGSGVRGLVSVSVLAAGLSEFLPSRESQAAGVNLVVDGAGRLGGSTVPGDAAAVLRDSGAREALARGDGPFRGGGWVGWALPVGSTEWKLVHARREDETLGFGLLDARVDIPVLILVVPILAALVILPLRLGAQPLARLSAGARRLGSGDLSFRLPAAEVREFSVITEAFNGMAGRLEAAQQELIAANTRLEVANATLEQRVVERTQALEIEQRRALELERRSAEERAQRALLQQELTIGRSIQSSLLSPQRVRHGCFEILSRCVPSREVGGDMYNVFEIAHPSRTGAGELGILVGDVAGKGVPAALYMAVTTTLVEGQAQLLDSPVETLSAANSELYRRLRKPGARQTLFVTALYGILDGGSREIRLTNAGQSPPIYWPAGGAPFFLQMKGMPLGAFRKPIYQEVRLKLGKGDRLLFYSDGFIEVPGPTGEWVGYDGLLQRVAALAAEGGEGLVEGLFGPEESAADFFDYDDRTLVLITCVE